MSPVVTWAIICVFCLCIEILVPGDLVSIWFALGALITCLISLFNIPMTARIVIFVIASALSMILLRPICLRALKKNTNKTNLEALKSNKVKIIEPVLEDTMGTVKIDGVVWNCVSADGDTIASGTVCEIVEIQGNKLVVKPKN